MTSLIVLDGTVHEGRMRVNQQEGVEEFKCYLIWQMAQYIALKLGACSWEQRRMETQKKDVKTCCTAG